MADYVSTYYKLLALDNVRIKVILFQHSFRYWQCSGFCNRHIKTTTDKMHKLRQQKASNSPGKLLLEFANARSSNLSPMTAAAINQRTKQLHSKQSNLWRFMHCNITVYKQWQRVV